MAKIEKLTAEQQAQLAVKRDEWLAVGFNASPADRAEAERGVDLAYRSGGLEPPRFKIWLRSPLEGVLATALLAEILRRNPDALALPSGVSPQDFRKSAGAQVGAQVGDQVWAQVGDQVRDQVRAQARAQVGDQVWAQVGAQVGDQVGDQVRDQVGDQVRDQARAQVGDQVWAQVGAQVGDQVRDQVGDQVRAQVWAQVSWSLWGQHDAGYLGWMDTFHSVVGIKECERAAGLIAVARSSGWWWALRGFAILTERPTFISRDERGRLHCENRAALEYPDGWGVYAWHGVRVSEQLILRPQNITWQQIDQETNAEVRRVMIERYGMDRYLLDGGAAELHRDETGILYRKELSGDEPLVSVRVLNSTPEPDGSIKTYWLRVHPELRPMLDGGRTGEPQEMTARNAVASTFGMVGADYHPVVET